MTFILYNVTSVNYEKISTTEKCIIYWQKGFNEGAWTVGLRCFTPDCKLIVSIPILYVVFVSKAFPIEIFKHILL